MIHSVLVVGGGTMGRGIAQTIATAGVAVVLREINEAAAQRALAGIRDSLRRAVDKQKIDADEMERALLHLRVTDRLADGADAPLAIEAIVEQLDAKQALFAELDRLLAPTAILATNTSALSVSRIAEACAHPERVLGLHFFNPVPALPLVEVVKGQRTSAETVAAARAFVERIGKAPIVVHEAPGFVVNRLLIPLINEAAQACAAGVASAADIDAAMKLGAGHPTGPLALADLIGLDIVVAILETLERELGDPKYRPCPLLKDMVLAGTLGRKTKKGFFEYAS